MECRHQFYKSEILKFQVIRNNLEIILNAWNSEARVFKINVSTNILIDCRTFCIRGKSFSQPITAWCFLFIPPENIFQGLYPLMFSGGIKRERRTILGYHNFLSNKAQLRIHQTFQVHTIDSLKA